MSELTVTPELALTLQQAAREVGLSLTELTTIIKPETLELLLPLIKQQAKLVLHNRIPVWREIVVSPNITSGRQFVEVLERASVRDHFFSFDAISSQLHIGVSEPTVYVLYKATLDDLGIREALSYDKVLKRARMLGIHDDTAPLTLVTALVEQCIVKAQERKFKYRVCTKPSRANWFGQETDFVFSLANGFIPEDPADTTLKKSDVLLLSCRAGPEADEIYPTEDIIFSRKKTGAPDVGLEIGLPANAA